MQYSVIAAEHSAPSPAPAMVLHPGLSAAEQHAVSASHEELAESDDLLHAMVNAKAVPRPTTNKFHTRIARSLV